jgi:hypothetical protein
MWSVRDTASHRRADVTLFVIRREDDGRFWAGDDNWHEADRFARAFDKPSEAFAEIALTRQGPIIEINIVPKQAVNQ